MNMVFITIVMEFLIIQVMRILIELELKFNTYITNTKTRQSFIY